MALMSDVSELVRGFRAELVALAWRSIWSRWKGTTRHGAGGNGQHVRGLTKQRTKLHDGRWNLNGLVEAVDWPRTKQREWPSPGYLSCAQDYRLDMQSVSYDRQMTRFASHGSS